MSSVNSDPLVYSGIRRRQEYNNQLNLGIARKYQSSEIAEVDEGGKTWPTVKSSDFRSWVRDRRTINDVWSHDHDLWRECQVCGEVHLNRESAATKVGVLTSTTIRRKVRVSDTRVELRHARKMVPNSMKVDYACKECQDAALPTGFVDITDSLQEMFS